MSRSPRTHFPATFPNVQLVALRDYRRVSLLLASPPPQLASGPVHAFSLDEHGIADASRSVLYGILNRRISARMSSVLMPPPQSCGSLLAGSINRTRWVSRPPRTRFRCLRPIVNPDSLRTAALESGPMPRLRRSSRPGLRSAADRRLTFMNHLIPLSVLLAVSLAGCGNATKFGQDTGLEDSVSVPELLSDEELRNRAPAQDEYAKAMSDQ